MSNAQAERAINQLYESDTLRSELRDEEASLLLSWGEVRVDELAQRDLPDDHFDTLTENLRALLAAINVLVGKRKAFPSRLQSMMSTVSSAAQTAGYTLTPDEQALFLSQHDSLANQDAISELLGLLKPAAELPPPPIVAEVAAQAAPVEPAVIPPPVVEASPVVPEPSLVPESVSEVEMPSPTTLPEVSAEPIPESPAPIPPSPADLPELPSQES